MTKMACKSYLVELSHLLWLLLLRCIYIYSIGVFCCWCNTQIKEMWTTVAVVQVHMNFMCFFSPGLCQQLKKKCQIFKQMHLIVGLLQTGSWLFWWSLASFCWSSWLGFAGASVVHTPAAVMSVAPVARIAAAVHEHVSIKRKSQ